MTIHGVKPMSSQIGNEAHLMVWVEPEKMADGAVAAAGRAKMRRMRLWPILRSERGIALCHQLEVRSAAGLAGTVCDAPDRQARTTLWLPRGWPDAVMCGLVDAIDAGQYVRQYTHLDGDVVVMRGLWHGRRVDVTSLGAWTGGAWDGWRDAVLADTVVGGLIATSEARTEDELVAARTVAAILVGGMLWRAGPCRLAMPAQARQWWATSIGPVLEAVDPSHKADVPVEDMPRTAYVAPLPWRPLAVRHAERQACYGLPTEQYVAGPIDGPVYTIDMHGSYLACLLHCPIPTAWERTIQRPKPRVLADALEGRTGTALVLLASQDHPYPVRRSRKIRRAVGTYWTWLAGCELAGALQNHRVVQCEVAHLWDTLAPDPSRADEILSGLREIKAAGGAAIRAVLRGLYSTLVGSFASWGRQWTEMPGQSAFGRWASWSEIDGDTGELAKWRSIAGRVEKLVLSDSNGSAVAQVYADILARARTYVYDVCAIIGWQHVFQCAADAIWVSQTGYDRWRTELAAGCADCGSFAAKDTYDRIWLDGDGRTLAAADGERYAHIPGIPHETPLDADGRCVWSIHSPWDAETHPSADRGARVRVRSYNAASIERAAGTTQRKAEPWLQLNDLGLPDELVFCSGK